MVIYSSFFHPVVIDEKSFLHSQISSLLNTITAAFFCNKTFADETFERFIEEELFRLSIAVQLCIFLTIVCRKGSDNCSPCLSYRTFKLGLFGIMSAFSVRIDGFLF